ncbi:MAG: response regulator [Dehalococcoidia bacterium]|nr:response regulator [Dehalococcoidia bacterium]
MPLPPAHILLVEDDAPSRRLLALALRSEGYEVTDASSAEAALAALEAADTDFRVLVTDVKMPGIGGTGLLQRLRTMERWRSLPALVVTGLANPAEALCEAGEGRVAYLAKPVHLSEFFAVVASLVDGTESLG